jgi:putative membrane protein
MLSFNTSSQSQKDRVFLPIITAVSVSIPLVVALLMYLPKEATESGSLSNLPLFHALLNGSTALFLLLGLTFLRMKKIGYHRISMLTAFFLSSLFLVSYVIYHFNVNSTKFGGQGYVRYVYFFILLTHILLATSIVPLALTTIYRSFSKDFAKHKKLARWTFPIWLYVAITGVVIYIMMKPYYI